MYNNPMVASPPDRMQKPILVWTEKLLAKGLCEAIMRDAAAGVRLLGSMPKSLVSEACRKRHKLARRDRLHRWRPGWSAAQ